MARTTTWSVRRTEWVLRKFFLGKPSDQVALPGWLPWWVTAARLRLGATYAGSMTKYGLPAPDAQARPVAPGAVGADPRAAQGRRGDRPAGDRAARRRRGRLRRRHQRAGGPHRVGHRLPHQLPVPRARPGVGGRQRPAAVEAHRPPGPPRPLLRRPRAGRRRGDAGRRGAVGLDRRDPGRRLRPAVGRRRPAPDAGRARARHRQFYASPRHTLEVDFDHYLWDLERERKAGRTRAAAARTPSSRPSRRSPRRPAAAACGVRPRSSRCVPCAGRRSATCRSAASSSALRTPRTGTGC